MKKNILLLFIAKITITFSLAGVEMLTNPTISGLGNPVQQAVISSDSVFYNPSALSFLENGSYISIGNSFTKINYRSNVKIMNKEIATQSTTMQYIPAISYIYNDGKKSYYIGNELNGQGGIMKFKIHYPNQTEKEIKKILIPIGITFGVSKKIYDNFSVSLGGKYTYIYQKYDLNIFNEEQEILSWGLAPEIGIYYKITPKLDFGAKYLFSSKMERNGKSIAVNENNHIYSELNKTYRRDYPALFSIGTKYNFDDKNNYFVGYNKIFEKDAEISYQKYGEYSNTNEYMIGYERILNDKLNLNFGYTKVDKGKNKKIELRGIQDLNLDSFGISLVYKKIPEIKYIISLSFNIYKNNNIKEINSNGVITENYFYRRETNLGIGIQKKI